jgi:hypothetical protein
MIRFENVLIALGLGFPPSPYQPNQLRALEIGKAKNIYGGSFTGSIKSSCF